MGWGAGDSISTITAVNNRAAVVNAPLIAAGADFIVPAFRSGQNRRRGFHRAVSDVNSTPRMVPFRARTAFRGIIRDTPVPAITARIFVLIVETPARSRLVGAGRGGGKAEQTHSINP